MPFLVTVPLGIPYHRQGSILKSGFSNTALPAIPKQEMVELPAAENLWVTSSPLVWLLSSFITCVTNSLL